MRDPITPQFVSDNLPGFSAMTTHQSLEEALGCCNIPFGLEIDIHHLATLVNGTPQIMLFAIDVDEGFVNVEGIAIASMFTLQSSVIDSSELDAPKAYSFSADSDAPFSQQVLNIAMTQIEAIIEPDGVLNNVRWESVSLISVHGQSVPISAR